MSGKTSIEWTDATWNPVRGCSRVSEGCRNCYAEGIAARFNKPGQAFEGLAVMKSDGPHWTGKVRLVEEHLNDPLRWKKPRRIFVNSMSDLFHEELPIRAIAEVFNVMASWTLECRQKHEHDDLCYQPPRHIYQILTKRPERMLRVLETELEEEVSNYWPGESPIAVAMEHRWPLRHVWLGVSVENQKAADERIPMLIKTPASVRFLSIEPLLGPVDLDKWIGYCDLIETDGKSCPSCIAEQQIHWVIVGGESGRGARPMHPQWARDIQNQCDYAGIPFFFKQWGEWAAEERDGAEVELSTLKSNQLVCAGSSESTHTLYTRVGKHVAGRKLDGIEHSAFPAVSI